MEIDKIKTEIIKLENKKKQNLEKKELTKKLNKLEQELREKSKLEKTLNFLFKSLGLFGKRIARHIDEKNKKNRK